MLGLHPNHSEQDDFEDCSQNSENTTCFIAEFNLQIDISEKMQNGRTLKESLDEAMIGLRTDSALIIKPRDQRTTRSEDRPVRIGPRFSKFCWSWSGPVSFEIFLGPSRTNRFRSVDPLSSQNQNCQMF